MLLSTTSSSSYVCSSIVHPTVSFPSMGNWSKLSFYLPNIIISMTKLTDPGDNATKTYQDLGHWSLSFPESEVVQELVCQSRQCSQTTQAYLQASNQYNAMEHISNIISCLNEISGIIHNFDSCTYIYQKWSRSSRSQHQIIYSTIRLSTPLPANNHHLWALRSQQSIWWWDPVKKFRYNGTTCKPPSWRRLLTISICDQNTRCKLVYLFKVLIKTDTHPWSAGLSKLIT